MDEQSANKWFGSPDFGKIICVDFDGVIAKFDGWRGPNVFGDPIPGAAEALIYLHLTGWTIYIFTSRLVTKELVTWLYANGIPFDDINGRVAITGDNPNYCFLQTYDGMDCHESMPWKLNPSNSSFKPIASVYLDDMNFENGGKNYDAAKWELVAKDLWFRFG